ncbi:glycerate kinase [Niabella drilacis]|uniref:Glycerate kinase n=1 Tax=Niabella drilacis (strain DSM 25811 / CCM 8410 / CCUG 62505 / LMG 26954 / E90) TaxID=1285928 RepID=A0A1G6IXA4_NIADE|nr:glycerate kinase [Niabella drilacis]SDC11192.1 glycerate kinase [Niabella drilacis]
MKIVIAPNAFKNSLPAAAVAAALAEGIRSSGYTGAMVCCPVGDGGDGTGSLLQQYLGAEPVVAEVADPLGRPVKAPFGWIKETGTAIIEMADASGLRLLNTGEYKPLEADTTGCGQLIKAALDHGAGELLLCIGGSATVDGGTGALRALGLQLLASNGATLQRLPADLVNLGSIGVAGLDQRLRRLKIRILCDVKNHLLGAKGAAAVFGPQKGAGARDVALLEAALQRWRQVVLLTTGIDINKPESSGAAGGIAAGLSAFCNVAIVDGIGYFLERINFEQELEGAGWVITGEGSIDHQTLEGKAPFGVAVMAKQRGIPVVGVAGKVPEIPDPELQRYFQTLWPINEQPVALEEAIRQTRVNLVRTGLRIGVALQAQNRSGNALV